MKSIRSWAYESEFFFSEDFKYFAFAPQASQNTVLEFYGNGELMMSYTVDDLVKDLSAVRYTITTAMWLTREGLSGIEQSLAHNTLTLTTVDNLTYVFDISTGAILEPSDREPLSGAATDIVDSDWLILRVAITIIVFGCTTFILIRRKRL